MCAACGLGRAQRLPNGVRPEHYSLVIAPDLKAATFTGSELIDVMLDKPAMAITLNAAEIQFEVVRASVGAAPRNDKQTDEQQQQATATASNRQQPQQEKMDAVVSLNAAKEQATFTFAHALPAGPVTLEIAYTGILNDKLRGFYLSKTKLRNYGVTQFEATDARRAFPSFDEPALKASFDVSLVIDTGDTAISNTKIVRDRPGPVAGKHTVAFAPTPKMSTYLVAWLVGVFQCSQGKQDGVPIRVCATPDKVALTKFALDAAKWYLHYYDQYFAIKYPLKKLDMVAIPDFEAGAMENFGCITYRETELLVDKKNGGLEAKKQVAQTVAHEMSHQWFGDLVTPAWWDNLWLNEGFATWMETKAPSEWQPTWEYAQDVAIEKDHTMNEDAGKTTRAIRTKAETPAEINELFDDIAYGKAGAVVAMVENWVGEDVFRKGVQQYLAAHAYGNATAEDFWDTQARVSGLPVDTVMRSFVDQPGVPQVTLAGSGALPQLTERRFSISGSPVGAESWTIPVCFKGGSCRLLTPLGATLDGPLPVSSGMPFAYADAAGKGYYRTAYAPAELKAIVRNAESGLTPPERIGLLGDQWALMRAGQATVGEFLDLVLALKQDTSATVMELALGKVATIATEIATDDDRKQLDAVVRQEFGPVYAALGEPTKHETLEHARLRETLFDVLGRAQDPAVLAEAEFATRQMFAGRKPADPTIADAAVALATTKGDVAFYERLLQVSQSATDPDLKEAAMNGLTRFQNPALVRRTLEYAISDAVRNQDNWTLIALLIERRETQDQAWEFVEQHWPEIARKLTANSGARIVEAAGAFCSVDKRDQVTGFFREHAVVSAERTLAKTVDNINECTHLRADQEPELRRWLGQHAGAGK
jgi:aminopeptidase N/puromycin-sensitive aminopeptidase